MYSEAWLEEEIVEADVFEVETTNPIIDVKTRYARASQASIRNTSTGLLFIIINLPDFYYPKIIF